MNRLVIESIEGRVLAGITMFVAIMVLIGWVAINEPARMASFVDQQEGRSIERGGELFAANCSTCHGTDGRGQAEIVPALDNPALFGHDFFNGVNGQIGRLQRQQAEHQAAITTLTTQRDGLLAEVASANNDRRGEITTQINDIDTQTTDLNQQIADMDTQLAPLLQQRSDTLEALQPALDAGYLAGLDGAIASAEASNDPLSLTIFIDTSMNRLTQAGWGSDLKSFLRTTLYHGRPGTAPVWGGKQMVAWAQLGGGPLRADEIDYLVEFMSNWDKGDAWTTDDLFAVRQFMKLKADASMITAGEPVVTINSESAGSLDTATQLVTALTGDAANGQALYNGQARSAGGQRLACSSCHMGGAQAPATDKKWDDAANVRIQLPEFAGWTVEKYMIDSIIYPNEYVVPGYSSGIMPNEYGDQLSGQDLADMLAYLKTYSTTP